MSAMMDSMGGLTQELLRSPDPSVAFRANRLFGGQADDDPQQQRRRELVSTSDNARRLLSLRSTDGHAYRKWQGPHFTLAGLAELGFPAGDAQLRPLFGEVYDWLFSSRHLRPPHTAVIPDQPDRVRRCASQEGLAIWYSMELGSTDERVDELVERLLSFQWPDGGWNCDRKLSTRTSSVQETLLPLRGLVRYARERPSPQGLDAIHRAAEFLLARQLLWRRHDGAPIRPDWGKDPMRIQWPIRFYDVLFALVVMTEADRVGDDRCAAALELLRGKELPGGGFPAELRTAKRADHIVSGGTFADWGPTGRTHPNPFVTVDATWVLLKAGGSGSTVTSG